MPQKLERLRESSVTSAAGGAGVGCSVGNERKANTESTRRARAHRENGRREPWIAIGNFEGIHWGTRG